MTDETLLRAMLFDFYGELLTDKQREYFDLHYNEDLSLSRLPTRPAFHGRARGISSAGRRTPWQLWKKNRTYQTLYRAGGNRS